MGQRQLEKDSCRANGKDAVGRNSLQGKDRGRLDIVNVTAHEATMDLRGSSVYIGKGCCCSIYDAGKNNNNKSALLPHQRWRMNACVRCNTPSGVDMMVVMVWSDVGGVRVRERSHLDF